MNFKNFDIFDLNYEFSSNEFGIFDCGFDKASLPKKGIVARILSLFFACFFLLLKNKKKKKIIPKNSILFFGQYNNEKRPFYSILKTNNSYHIIGDDRYINGFPILKIYLTSLLFIPIVLLHYFINKDKIKKLSFKYAFDFYCLSFAAILIVPKYLKKINPKKIFISNHTRPFQRIIMKLYSKRGLGYIQHASFTHKMPPFEDFEYLLIDGKDSLNKLITTKASNNNIFLIGNSMYDESLSYTKINKDLKSIGICVNNADYFDDIILVVKEIKSTYPLIKLFLRPHPSEPRFEKMKKFSSTNDVIFSNSRDTNSLEFLKNIDFLIAGDSNIHLESIFLNIPSIYLNFKDNKKDWYGFLKYKMLCNANSSTQIIDILKKIDLKNLNIRQLAKPFNSSINTLYEGKSSSLVLKIIHGNKSFIKNKFNRKIDINNNYIYNLKE